MSLLQPSGNQFHIMKSTRKNKKYVAMFKNGTKIHFGDSRYDDYTSHKNIERKKGELQEPV